MLDMYTYTDTIHGGSANFLASDIQDFIKDASVDIAVRLGIASELVRRELRIHCEDTFTSYIYGQGWMVFGTWEASYVGEKVPTA